MRGLLIACALGLATAALAADGSNGRTACHPEDPGHPTQWILHGNVDRDADHERVVQTVGGCPHRISLVLEDRCRGQTRRYRIPGHGNLARLDFVEANGRSDGHEILFGLWPGRRLGRYRGNVGLVHLESVAGRCPRPVYLLAYNLRPKPHGASDLTHLEVLRSSRLELRVLESFVLRSRETRFRYVPGKRRYVRYRVTTTKA